MSYNVADLTATDVSLYAYSTLYFQGEDLVSNKVKITKGIPIIEEQKWPIMHIMLTSSHKKLPVSLYELCIVAKYAFGSH